MTGVSRHPGVSLRGDGVLPLLGYGTWRLSGRQCYEMVRYALDVGYRHIDTAAMYHNEQEVGRAVRDSGVPRDEVVVTTKLSQFDAGRERRALAASLRALNTDYVNLWLIHWPPGGQAAPRTWAELLTARDAGLARAVGVSNYDIAQIDELVAATGEAPAVNQIPWAPTLYDAAVLASHRDQGVAVEGYSPFRNTNLHDPTLVEIASRYQVSPAQLVLRWHVDHGVAAIPKSANPDRVAANFDIFGFSLTDEERRRIDGMAG